MSPFKDETSDTCYKCYNCYKCYKCYNRENASGDNEKELSLERAGKQARLVGFLVDQ